MPEPIVTLTTTPATTLDISQVSEALRTGKSLDFSASAPRAASTIGDDTDAFDDLGDPAAEEARAEAAAIATLDANGAPDTAGAQPRNDDGTFAPKGEKAKDVPAVDTQSAPDDATLDDTPAVEPKVFTLKGEAQRGEPDIELDITDIPEEVVKRLETLEARGMRRKEYDRAAAKLAKIEGEYAEFETELKMNADAVVTQRMDPESQLRVGARVLLERWDEMSPLIEEWWTDANKRTNALRELTDRSRSLQDTVKQKIEINRQVAAIRRAIDLTIPEGTDPADAATYRAAANAKLAYLVDKGTAVTPDSASTHLAELAARYGFQDAPETVQQDPPKRPKLVVRNAAQPNASSATSPARSSSRRAAASDAAIRAVSPPGVGHGAVRTPAPPQGATIEQVSAFIKTRPRAS